MTSTRALSGVAAALLVAALGSCLDQAGKQGTVSGPGGADAGSEDVAGGPGGDALLPTGDLVGTPDAAVDAQALPAGCCAVDAQCSGGLVCPISDPAAAQPVQCDAAPGLGECYRDEHCAASERCAGATVCPCGLNCDAMGPGTCQPLGPECAAGYLWDETLGACCPDAIWTADCVCKDPWVAVSEEVHDEHGCLVGIGCKCEPGPCSDGSQLLCAAVEPTCVGGTILAVQAGCWLCVDPATCLAPVPESCCLVDGDCQPDEVCPAPPGGADLAYCAPTPAEPGQCWTDAQCAESEQCVGGGWCPCGALCEEMVPGTCLPLMFPCCYADHQCQAGQRCVGGGPGGFPGTCVLEPMPGACWIDDDCGPEQACHGATACGCSTDETCWSSPGSCEGVPMGCCETDSDCDGDVCAPTFAGEGLGVCHPPAPAGTCWSDAACGPGEHCVGASVCPCGALCAVIDMPGECQLAACGDVPLGDGTGTPCPNGDADCAGLAAEMCSTSVVPAAEGVAPPICVQACSPATLSCWPGATCDWTIGPSMCVPEGCREAYAPFCGDDSQCMPATRWDPCCPHHTVATPAQIALDPCLAAGTDWDPPADMPAECTEPCPFDVDCAYSPPPLGGACVEGSCAPTSTKAGCCLLDQACGPGEVCVGAGLVGNMHGECMPPPETPGECWVDAHCPPDAVCEAPQPCGCDVDCDAGPIAGHCIPSLPPPIVVEMEVSCAHAPRVVSAGAPLPLAVFSEAGGCAIYDHAQVAIEGSQVYVTLIGLEEPETPCPPCIFDTLGLVTIDLPPGPGSFQVHVGDFTFPVYVSLGDLGAPGCDDDCPGPPLGSWAWKYQLLSSAPPETGCGAPWDIGSSAAFEGGCQDYTLVNADWPLEAQATHCMEHYVFFGSSTTEPVTDGTLCASPLGGDAPMLLGIHNPDYGAAGAAQVFVLEAY